jgi:chromate reductase, NAD(P)H dehydrogenase (quinone)
MDEMNPDLTEAVARRHRQADTQTLNILAISGSLRAASSNTAALRAMAALAPADLAISLYARLADLPHFNPDLDGETAPAVVHELRAQIGRADGVLISSPEYAHGVPGVLKNALDWLVSSLEFPGKPVALINTSPRATHAQASLVEILTTMSARLIGEASVTVPLPDTRMQAAGMIADPAVSSVLRTALVAFGQAIRLNRSQEET